MNNDNSLATTSMMSTTSQFSSPIESTEISDWSKAERITFIPPNGQSPSGTESFRVNFTNVPPQCTEGPTQVWRQMVGKAQQNGFQSFGQTQWQMPQSQNRHQQVVPSQSQWMQKIIQQNRKIFPGQRNSGIGGMRSYWEQRIQEERLERQRDEMTKSRHSLNCPRQFQFPRWRSVDPMTASLVASARTSEIIPMDSRMPEYRHEKLVETERNAQMDKFELHKPYIQMAIYRQHQRRGRSLLAPRPYQNESVEEMAKRRTMDLYDHESGQWYNPAQIHQAISHESTNVGATRQMWEQTTWQAQAQSDWEREQERQFHFAAQQRYWQ